MPNQYLEYGHKDSVFVEKMPNLSAQAQKFWILMKKRLHWASVVRVAVCALDNNAEAGPPTLPLVPLPCYCAMQYTMG